MTAAPRHLDPTAAERLGLPAVAPENKQEIYTVETAATPAQLYRVITAIGGANGWYYGNWLWNVRGWLDQLIGGVGTRRGVARPAAWHAGDILDFWRVEQVEADRVFVLHAEMKLGGEGRLGFYLLPSTQGTLLVQRALFRPTQWLGHVYWALIYPIHAVVFRGLAESIARRAEATAR